MESKQNMRELTDEYAREPVDARSFMLQGFRLTIAGLYEKAISVYEQIPQIFGKNAEQDVLDVVNDSIATVLLLQNKDPDSDSFKHVASFDWDDMDDNEANEAVVVSDVDMSMDMEYEVPEMSPSDAEQQLEKDANVYYVAPEDRLADSQAITGSKRVFPFAHDSSGSESPTIVSTGVTIRATAKKRHRMSSSEQSSSEMSDEDLVDKWAKFKRIKKMRKKASQRSQT